jgi:glycosyltransferase involved in cell wall biosynthesis
VVAPSRWDEPCPYTVIEAMAAGLPVLASDRGGMPELVGEGDVLPPDDPAAWAAAMAKLWDADAERERRGAAALQRARDLFGEERFYSGLMEVYEGREAP